MIEGVEYAEAEVDFFDDLVRGVDARRSEIDEAIAGTACRAAGHLERLDRAMRAILRAGTYELLARPDVPAAVVVTEYVDVAHAFFDKREAGFVNGLLDAVSKDVRELNVLSPLVGEALRRSDARERGSGKRQRSGERLGMEE